MTRMSAWQQPLTGRAESLRGPGATQEPGSGSRRVSHRGYISACHLLSAPCHPGEGVVVGDGARCQLHLYTTRWSGPVTSDLCTHLLMGLSGMRALLTTTADMWEWKKAVTDYFRWRWCWQRLKSLHGNRLQCSISPLLPRLLSVSASCCYRPGLDRWHYSKMRQLLCRNGRSWLHCSRCVGCQAQNLQIDKEKTIRKGQRDFICLCLSGRLEAVSAREHGRVNKDRWTEQVLASFQWNICIYAVWKKMVMLIS